MCYPAKEFISQYFLVVLQGWVVYFSYVDSLSHILIHCPFVVDAILQDFGMSWMSSADVNSHLVSWRSSAFTPKGKMLWSMVSVALWWSV